MCADCASCPALGTGRTSSRGSCRLTKCLDRIDALADKHRIDRDLARRMAAELDHYDEAA
jgi:hypothetical protein